MFCGTNLLQMTTDLIHRVTISDPRPPLLVWKLARDFGGIHLDYLSMLCLDVTLEHDVI